MTHQRGPEGWSFDLLRVLEVSTIDDRLDFGEPGSLGQSGLFGLDTGETNNGLKAILGKRWMTAAFSSENGYESGNVATFWMKVSLGIGLSFNSCSAKLILDVPHVPPLEAESLGVKLHG